MGEFIEDVITFATCLVFWSILFYIWFQYTYLMPPKPKLIGTLYVSRDFTKFSQNNALTNPIQLTDTVLYRSQYVDALTGQQVSYFWTINALTPIPNDITTIADVSTWMITNDTQITPFRNQCTQLVKANRPNVRSCIFFDNPTDIINWLDPFIESMPEQLQLLFVKNVGSKLSQVPQAPVSTIEYFMYYTLLSKFKKTQLQFQIV